MKVSYPESGPFFFKMDMDERQKYLALKREYIEEHGSPLLKPKPPRKPRKPRVVKSLEDFEPTVGEVQYPLKGRSAYMKLTMPQRAEYLLHKRAHEKKEAERIAALPEPEPPPENPYEGIGIYKNHKRKKVEPLTYKETILRLTAITQCNRMDAGFWYDAVTELIFHELSNLRPVELPRTGIIIPEKTSVKRFWTNNQWMTIPKWIRFKVRVARPMKTELMKTHPCYVKEEYDRWMKEDLI